MTVSYVTLYNICKIWTKMFFSHLQQPPLDAAVAPAPGASLWPPCGEKLIEGINVFKT